MKYLWIILFPALLYGQDWTRVQYDSVRAHSRTHRVVWSLDTNKYVIPFIIDSTYKTWGFGTDSLRFPGNRLSYLDKPPMTNIIADTAKWNNNSVPSLIDSVNWNTAYTRSTLLVADSAKWNTAYSQTLEWNGGSTNLVAATGRASLGLNNGAMVDTVEFGGKYYARGDTSTVLASKSFLGNQYVPYTGATANLNLSTFTISAANIGNVAAIKDSTRIAMDDKANTFTGGANHFDSLTINGAVVIGRKTDYAGYGYAFFAIGATHQTDIIRVDTIDPYKGLSVFGNSTWKGASNSSLPAFTVFNRAQVDSSYTGIDLAYMCGTNGDSIGYDGVKLVSQNLVRTAPNNTSDFIVILRNNGTEFETMRWRHDSSMTMANGIKFYTSYGADSSIYSPYGIDVRGIKATGNASIGGTLVTTSYIIAKGDVNSLNTWNTAGTEVIGLGTIKGWTGSGSTTNAAIGAVGSLSFYSNNSNTAAMVLNTDYSLTLGSVAGTGTGAFYSGAITSSGLGTFSNTNSGGLEQIRIYSSNTANGTVLGGLWYDINNGSSDYTAVKTYGGKTSNTSGGDYKIYVANTDWSLPASPSLEIVAGGATTINTSGNNPLSINSSSSSILRNIITSTPSGVRQVDFQLSNNSGNYYFGINDVEGEVFYDNRLTSTKRYSWQFSGVEKMSLDASGNATFAGTIQTTSNAAWDLGAGTTTVGVTPSTTKYVTVTIGGVVHKLLEAN